jgi:hypothetical protein
MGRKSIRVRTPAGLVRQARGAGGSALFAALLLLGCSGTSETEANGGTGQGGAAAAGRPNSSGGRTTGGVGGDEATAGGGGDDVAAAGGGRTASGGTGGRASGGTGGRASGGTGGRASGGTGGGSVANTSLGSTCTSDAQCGNGMVCALAKGTWLGDGGPSNGMCTMACSPGGTECAMLKPGAECFDFGTAAAAQGYCLDSCTGGDPMEVQSKCAGRFDFLCADLGETSVEEFCVPHCRSDAECGAGLFCDKSQLLGLCSKTKPPAGDPVGSPCTPGAAINTCEGYCIRTSADGVKPPTGNCVELCSGGSECMYSSGSSPAPGGFCGGALSDAFGAIDLGYCLSNCSCTGDCKLSGDLCRKWPDAEANLATALGAPGLCYPVLAQSVELTCSQGGAGGGSAGAPAQTGGASGTGP